MASSQKSSSDSSQPSRNDDIDYSYNYLVDKRGIEIHLLATLSHCKFEWRYGVPSYNWIEYIFPSFPDSLRWKIWKVIGHLYQPGPVDVFKIVIAHCFPQGRIHPAQVPANLTLASLKDIARAGSAQEASFNEFTVAVDKMLQWVDEAAARLSASDAKWMPHDGRSDEQVFWDDLKGGTTSQQVEARARRERLDEGPYGERDRAIKPLHSHTFAKSRLVVSQEAIFERNLLVVLSMVKPNRTRIPPFPNFVRVFHHIPETLVWQIWTIIDHLFHSSTWYAFTTIFPYPPGQETYDEGTLPPNLSLNSLKKSARKRSYDQLLEELDKMTCWVEETYQRYKHIGPDWRDLKSDDKMFWSDMKYGVFDPSRGKNQARTYHEEGPYGERERRPRPRGVDVAGVTASMGRARLDSSATIRP